MIFLLNCSVLSVTNYEKGKMFTKSKKNNRETECIMLEEPPCIPIILVLVKKIT